MVIKENIPQNINEIYELGNKIRRKNKNKKKKEIKAIKCSDNTLLESFKITPSVILIFKAHKIIYYFNYRRKNIMKKINIVVIN